VRWPGSRPFALRQGRRSPLGGNEPVVL
jgi:hypothetical protein